MQRISGVSPIRFARRPQPISEPSRPLAPQFGKNNPVPTVLYVFGLVAAFVLGRATKPSSSEPSSAVTPSVTQAQLAESLPSAEKVFAQNQRDRGWDFSFSHHLERMRRLRDEAALKLTPMSPAASEIIAEEPAG